MFRNKLRTLTMIVPTTRIATVVVAHVLVDVLIHVLATAIIRALVCVKKAAEAVARKAVLVRASILAVYNCIMGDGYNERIK